MFLQQVIAGGFRDSDAFAVKTEKVEKAVQTAVLKEMTMVQVQDPETYRWLMANDGYISSVLLAEFRDGTPRLSARKFTFIPDANPSVQISKCDYYDETGLCYMGKSTHGVQDFAEILKTTPEPLEATRRLVEKEIKDFPNDVGPPVITLVLDKDGPHVIPPDATCPVEIEPPSL